MSANDRQVAGDHYKGTIQHWDLMLAQNVGYMEGQITKYVLRWKNKNGLEDLQKAKHFLEKLIEHVEIETVEQVPGLMSNVREDIENPFGFDGE